MKLTHSWVAIQLQKDNLSFLQDERAPKTRKQLESGLTYKIQPFGKSHKIVFLIAHIYYFKAKPYHHLC